MKIARIQISPAKGEARRTPERAELVIDKGIKGDRYARGGARQVSLTDVSGEAQARKANGLCCSRFAANILTEGLDYSALSVGDTLDFGLSSIEITQLGKECYPECPIAARGDACPLPASCAFARVARAGEIFLNDEITLRKART